MCIRDRAKLNVGNTKLQKVSSNTSITDGNGNYSISGATYGVFANKDCTKPVSYTHLIREWLVCSGEKLEILK